MRKILMVALLLPITALCQIDCRPYGINHSVMGATMVFNSKLGGQTVGFHLTRNTVIGSQLFINLDLTALHSDEFKKWILPLSGGFTFDSNPSGTSFVVISNVGYTALKPLKGVVGYAGMGVALQSACMVITTGYSYLKLKGLNTETPDLAQTTGGFTIKISAVL